MPSDLLKLQMFEDRMIDLSQNPDSGKILPQILGLYASFYSFISEVVLGPAL